MQQRPMWWNYSLWRLWVAIRVLVWGISNVEFVKFYCYNVVQPANTQESQLQESPCLRYSNHSIPYVYLLLLGRRCYYQLQFVFIFGFLNQIKASLSAMVVPTTNFGEYCVRLYCRWRWFASFSIVFVACIMCRSKWWRKKVEHFAKFLGGRE